MWKMEKKKKLHFWFYHACMDANNGDDGENWKSLFLYTKTNQTPALLKGVKKRYIPAGLIISFHFFIRSLFWSTPPAVIIPCPSTGSTRYSPLAPRYLRHQQHRWPRQQLYCPVYHPNQLPYSSPCPFRGRRNQPLPSPSPSPCRIRGFLTYGGHGCHVDDAAAAVAAAGMMDAEVVTAGVILGPARRKTHPTSR